MLLSIRGGELRWEPGRGRGKTFGMKGERGGSSAQGSENEQKRRQSSSRNNFKAAKRGEKWSKEN